MITSRLNEIAENIRKKYALLKAARLRAQNAFYQAIHKTDGMVHLLYKYTKIEDELASKKMEAERFRQLYDMSANTDMSTQLLLKIIESEITPWQ